MSKMNSGTYDVVVVGAGISGLLSALALSKERKTVLVLEKSGFIGGNCRSYNVGGFRMDTGIHSITTLKNGGPLIELMKRYFNIIPKFLPYGNYYIRDGEKLLRCPYTLQALARFSILSKKDRLLMARTFVEATKAHTTSEKDLEISVHEFIRKRGLSVKAVRLIDTICYFLSGKSMHETPVWRILSGGGTTDELSRGMKKKLSGMIGIVVNRQESRHAYPAGGIQTITDAALASMPPDRCTIRTGEEVIRIMKKGETFVSVTSKGEFQSDQVIFTGDAKDLPQIYGGALPEHFTDSLRSLKQSRSMTLWLGLSKKRHEFNYLGSEIVFDAETPYWAMPISNHDPQLAPEGMQLVGFTSVMKDREKESSHRKILFDTIKKTFPGIEKDIVMQHVQVTVPEKAAITVGAKFPDPRTSVSGLYLAGTDADSRSMGISRASYSVLEMLKRMKEDKAI